jgi:ABC-type glycerol-3-phosphate transport system substrate-binding protein
VNGLTRRSLARLSAVPLVAGTGTAGVLLAACGPVQTPVEPRAADLSGTFEFIAQNWPPLNTIHEKSIASFNEKNPQSKVSYAPVPNAEIPTKVRASIAAGAGPDGYFNYSGSWRGANAATYMLPLTPSLFKRNELERIFYPNLLNSVWARNNEVYFLPAFVGMGAAGVLWNVAQLASANVDPKGFTTLDAIVAAASRLVRREGGAITRAGVLTNHTTTLVYRWVLDQGAKFYNEQTNKWSWQTVEAERALQWIVDLYDKHAVTWRQAPPGVGEALGEGHASMVITGPFSLSGYRATHPDVKLEDRPLPGFVPGKVPIYYEPQLAGYSLSALLKPEDVKARIGAAYYRHLLSPENAIMLANEYSGCILIRGLYESPAFKQSTFGTVRADLPQTTIARIVLIHTGADPGFGTQLNKIIAGELSIKAALAEMQQLYSVAEEEALRNRG